MQDIFKRWNTPRLRGHLVWIPMLSSDNLEAAIAQAERYHDPRVHQYWDGKRALGRLVSQTLQLSTSIAWDVYLLYLPGATWQNERPPAPDFWMHQLDERRDLYLDPIRLVAAVQKAIEADLESNR